MDTHEAVYHDQYSHVTTTHIVHIIMLHVFRQILMFSLICKCWPAATTAVSITPEDKECTHFFVFLQVIFLTCIFHTFFGGEMWTFAHNFYLKLLCF
jgi:hypothetical protein